MVPDAAVFIADDGVGAGLGRGHLDHVLVAGDHLDVDVGRLQRETVVVVDRREVDLVGLAGFQFQDRIPGPQAGQQEGLALGVGLGDRNLLFGLGADGVFPEKQKKILKRHLISCIHWIFLTYMYLLILKEIILMH